MLTPQLTRRIRSALHVALSSQLVVIPHSGASRHTFPIGKKANISVVLIRRLRPLAWYTLNMAITHFSRSFR